MSSAPATADVGAHRTPDTASNQRAQVEALLAKLVDIYETQPQSFRIDAMIQDYIRELKQSLKPLHEATEDKLLVRFVATTRLIRQVEAFIARLGLE